MKNKINILGKFTMETITRLNSFCYFTDASGIMIIQDTKVAVILNFVQLVSKHENSDLLILNVVM